MSAAGSKRWPSIGANLDCQQTVNRLCWQRRPWYYCRYFLSAFDYFNRNYRAWQLACRLRLHCRSTRRLRKCRSAINAGAGATAKILAHAFGVDSGQDFVDDATRINARNRGVLGKVLVGERVLVLEQEVVHISKPTLSAGGLSCMGRILVYVCKGKFRRAKHSRLPNCF